MTKALNKVIAVLDSLVNAAVITIGLLILFISVYSILDNVWQYQGAADSSLLAFKPDLDQPIKPERLISVKQGAWLYIEDTPIDYPVMQGEDNYEFLNKDPYGEFKLSGSIFLDYRNDSNFEDEYSIIYGHHMARNAMFGSLDKYKEQDYFDKHRDGRIVTVSTVYDLKIFAVLDTLANNRTVFDPVGRTTSEIIDFLNENATIFVEPEDGARIVALSTCSGDSSMMRLIVFGTIIAR